MAKGPEWSKDEINVLLQMDYDFKHDVDIAEVLGRSHHAVRAKRQKLRKAGQYVVKKVISTKLWTNARW